MDGERLPQTETVRPLVPLRARLGAWSMGCRDSDIGDRPAANWRIPFERLSLPFSAPVCGALRRPSLYTNLFLM